jgi:hypothetical protein
MYAKKQSDVDFEHLGRAIVIVADLRGTKERVMETGSVDDPS